MFSRILLVVGVATLLACESSNVPFLWTTYDHPTYRFSVKVPRTWEIQRANVAGADVAFLASDNDPVFRANANWVARPRAEKTEIQKLMNLSVAQLTLLFNEYQVLSRAPSQLGPFPGEEVRARYRGPEGFRILRTLVSVTDDMIYVATFTCREDRETNFVKTFDQMRRSFHAPRNLSGR